jgi:peptide/nickel transport system substrate-binding protein
MQLQSGQVDICTGLTSTGIAMLENSPGVRLISTPSTHVDYMSFNHTSPKLEDVRVRQALNYATDRDAIINAIRLNIGQRCASFIWPEAPHYNKDLPTYEYNPEKAKELLAEAGMSDLELNVIISAGSPDDLMQATILQGQWAEVGVMLEIQQMDSSARREQRDGLTFEILFNYLTSDIIDTAELMELVCLSEGSDCWHTGWHGEGQERAEALVREAGRTMDEEIRMKNYTEAQMIAAEEAIIIPICTIPEIVAVRDNVEGFDQSALGMYLFNNLNRD